MSRIGSPQISRATSTYPTAYAALERLSRQTPDLDDDDVPDTSPRTACRLLLAQGWGGNDSIIVEQNRKKIEIEVVNGMYWELEQRYWKSIKKEKQQSCQYLQPAPPTHTTIEQEDSVLVPRSVNLGLSPSKRVIQRGRVQNGGANTGRVQNRNPKGNTWTRKSEAQRHLSTRNPSSRNLP